MEYGYGHKPEFVVIAAPTDYDDEKDFFNTSILEGALEDALLLAPDAVIVIKSTIPVGYTKRINEKYNSDRIIFAPEFLREGKALYDNLYSYRVIVGEISERARAFADLMVEGAAIDSVSVLLMPY